MTPEKGYTEMKDSEISSFGLIPKDWEVKKIKSVFQLKSVKNTGDRELLSVYLDKGVISYTDSDGQQVHKPSTDLSNYQNVDEGDFVLNNQQAWRGSVGVSKYVGIISPAYVIYRMNDQCYAPYMGYLLRDKSMVQQYETSSRGVGTIQRNIFEPWLRNSWVIIPPIDTQKKIASFLDSRCAEIDNLSTDIQSEIDTLEEYKKSVITEAVTKGLNPDAETTQSRVFYMAPYNTAWRLSKIGYECTKLWRQFEPSDTPLICTNKGKVSIRPEEMSGKMVSEDNAMQGIRKGDIAIHGMDTWHGAIALSEHDGKITRVVHVCDSSQEKRFIVYYLQQLAFNGVYKLISNGVRGNTSDFRSWDKVKDIYIALPSIEEQVEIADYLDVLCKDVEAIIATKKQQLETLAEYKKSMIYEYVTGKRAV